MKPMTLDEIAEQIIIPAFKALTPESRSIITHESIMMKLRTPVGGLQKWRNK